MNNETSTFDKILYATRTLITAGGFNSFSYADIADAVGIRKASIHHHFPTKVDLVRTLLTRYRQEMELGTSKIDTYHPDPLSKLRAYAGYWERCILDSSDGFCICALLASELPTLPEELQLQVKAFFTSLSGWLTRVFENGLEEQSLQMSDDPSVEAESFMATVYGAMLSARVHGNPKIFGVIVNPLLERFLIRPL